MIDKIRFSVVNTAGGLITGDCRIGSSSAKLPLVILSHGFKGWKDWGFLPYLSEKIAESGAITICHNFSCNGMEEGSDLIARMEDFARITVSQEIEDLAFLIDSFTSGKIDENPEQYWNGDIFLMGHSMGGGVTLLLAADESMSWHDNIKKVVLLGCVGKWDRYSERQKEEWHRTGILEFPNNKTGQLLRLNSTMLEDIENNVDKLSLEVAMNKINIPILMLHGRQDVSVTLKEVDYLINSDNKNLRVEIIERTGHTFGIDQPFGGTSKALEKVFEESLNFFELK